MRPPHPATEPRRARTAVFAAFALAGVGFASWASRLPETRAALGLSDRQLGLLLLVSAAGSVASLPLAGGITARVGTTRAVTGGGVVTLTGLAWAAIASGVLHSTPLTAVGMLGMGLGMGTWDVAMNLEGAEVERRLGRATMPALHAGFSLGTVLAAGLGSLAAWLAVPVVVHLVVVAALAVAGVLGAVRAFLPAVGPVPALDAAAAVAVAGGDADSPRARSAPARSGFAAWGEPRVLLIGVLVLAAAFTEGTANDWLSIAFVDGYRVSPAVGALGFAAFLAAMTVARLFGQRALDRFGRVPVVRATMLLGAVGVLVVTFGGSPVVAAAGALLWGVGASLGFPVGISAAADEPGRAAARVSVVTTIGYTAFLAGPPLLGFLSDHWGVLRALLVVAVLAVPSLLVSRVAQPVARAVPQRARGA